MSAPEKLRLACGHDVPHEVGERVYNYYDYERGTIERLATRAEPDTSGLLPNGEAWWVDVRMDDGNLVGLDGSRMTCMDCAIAKGWLT